MALDQVDVDKLEEEEEKEMTFLDHLEELRWHLIRSVAAIVIFGILNFLGGKTWFEFVVKSPMDYNFPTYNFLCGISDVLCMRPPEIEFITREFGEQFMVHLKFSIVFGVILAVPVIFWEIWKFVKPALYETEQKVTRNVVLICSLLFMSGVSFGYFIIAPFAINFLGNYDIGATTAPTIASYLNYMTMFTMPTGLIFQLPIAIYFLSKLGVVTPEFLRTYRRHAIVIILIMSAIITPPDFITQLLIGFPLYGLYEISIRISARVQKQIEAETA